MLRFIIVDFPPTRILGDVTTSSALKAMRMADEDHGDLGYVYRVVRSARSSVSRMVFVAAEDLQLPGDGLDDRRALALVLRLPCAGFASRHRQALERNAFTSQGHAFGP